MFKKIIKAILMSLFILIFTGCDLIAPFIPDVPTPGPNDDYIVDDDSDIVYVCAKQEEDNDNTSSTKGAKRNTFYNLYSDTVESTVTINACFYIDSKTYEKQASGFIFKKEEKTNTNKYYLVTSASGILYRYVSTVPGRYESFDLSNTSLITEGDYEILFSDGSRIRVNYVASNVASDIAIFSFESNKDIKALEFSSEELEIGDDVFAIGSPVTTSNLYFTYLKGHVSGLDRLSSINFTSTINYDVYTTELFSIPTFQFDEPINGGMEGGPVLNSDGKVVGMISYGYNNDSNYESLSFALYADVIENVADILIKDKSYTKPVLGVTVGNCEVYQNTVSFIKSYRLYKGVYIVTEEENEVDGIAPDSPAAKANMKSGEVIVSIKVNDTIKEVTNLSSLSRILLNLKEGDSVIVNTKDSHNASHSYRVDLWS